jgi:hypothetical protein
MSLVIAAASLQCFVADGRQRRRRRGRLHAPLNRQETPGFAKSINVTP